MSEREEQTVQADADFGDVAVDEDADFGDGTVAEDVEAETVIDETLADSETVSDDSGLRDRLSTPVSKRGLAIAFLLSTLCLLAFGFVLPLGELLGLFVAGFGYGLASARRHYTEFLLSGLVTGGVWVLLGNVGLAVVSGTGILPLLLLGLVGGAFATTLGHYFGRDLRDGLTRDL